MACLVGFGAYRFEIVDHPVPVRIVAPDGSQLKQQSRACSRIWKTEPDVIKARRWISAHIWALNAAHERYPDAGHRFEADVAGCRQVQDAFIADLKIVTRSAKQRDGSLWLSPRAEIYTRVSDALIAQGMITEMLRDAVYDGRDPCKVDPKLSRTNGIGVVTAGNGKVRIDVDRRLRLRANPNVAPRFDDPRFYERLVLGLGKVGAPEPIEIAVDLARYSGGRWCQISALTLHDVLVMPRRGKVGAHIPSPNKGSGGERTMTLVPGRPRMERVFRWIDGGLKKLTGISLAEATLMAKDPVRREELKSIPLITEDGVASVKYGRMYGFFRKAAEKADLWIDDKEYRETDRRRFTTFHYLRHEYVHERMDLVALMPTKAAQLAGRMAIVSYMRWESNAMLEWYSAHHIIKLAVVAAENYNDHSDAQVAAGTKAHPNVGWSMESREIDEMLAGLA